MNLAVIWVLVAQAATPSPAPPLPEAVQVAIRKLYAFPGAETTYRYAFVDLNDDSKPEIVVHVLGRSACRSTGCPTLVFTPEAKGHRLVSTVNQSNLPVSLSPASSHGWRNLVVRIRRDGTEFDAELLFDGKSYPSNPTAASLLVTKATANATVLLR